MRVSLLCFALLPIACGSPARPTVPLAASRHAAPPPKREPWPRFIEAQSWPAAGAPFDDAGHGGQGGVALVRVSPEALVTYQHLVQDSALPEGAAVALFRSGAGGRTEAVLVMQKAAGKWTFLQLGPDGVTLGSSGGRQNSGDSCASCHRDGVADALFGLPHPSD